MHRRAGVFTALHAPNQFDILGTGGCFAFGHIAAVPEQGAERNRPLQPCSAANESSTLFVSDNSTTLTYQFNGTRSLNYPSADAHKHPPDERTVSSVMPAEAMKNGAFVGLMVRSLYRINAMMSRDKL